MEEDEGVQDKPGIVRYAAYRLGLADYLCQCLYDSIKYLTHFDLPIRVAFIDSSHDVATCHNEIALVKHRLVEGGVLAVHDSHYLGVPLAIKEHFSEMEMYVVGKLAVFYF